ncbi:ABC-F family ATP-binding cassette domain-containing protein [Gulosibacter bifidus]|uniref:ABC-F family ATP-binding cassette domain-containing protein n=1 Tax=Gulosibacter bifidus TaxID=272239 RepID=A0ABW5RJW7_9MICO|nr:ABC-F family ATP-binding cassette domain-containing protein [Gulosibacter bifidus]
MAHLLGAEHIHLEFPTKVVFDDVTIGINEGQRIGIVGRNGDGKSTFLRIISGDLQPDSGKVTVRSGTTIGMLTQRDSLDNHLTLGRAIVGDRAEYEWAGDPRIRDIIAGLVSDLDWDATIGSLSGGQRRRVALAQLLIQDWDILILDEPTNHLDVEGVAWLAAHVNGRWSANAGALVVVTHDRWFLDAVSTDTWEVHDGMIEPFEGGYAAYVLQRVERDRMAAAAEQKRQNLMRKELAWLRRGAPARTSKPKFRIDAANELIANEPPPRDAVALTQMATSRLGKEVVNLVDAGFAVDDREILRDVTWHIAPGERTGILGVNGAGKSTLLRLITGEIAPTSGRVKQGKTVKFATLSQQLHELDEVADDRVREVVSRKSRHTTAAGKELTPSQLLEKLGFAAATLQTPVKDLSGGQKRRLQLLLILLDEPNVLIMDEPTNDLDTDMLAAMEDLLDTWPGTLLVVSHDRYLLERVTDQQYGIFNGEFRHLPGGVDEYLAIRKQIETGGSGGANLNHPTAAASNAGAGASPETAGSASAPKLDGATRRALEKEAQAIERKLGKLRDALASADANLAAADQQDFEALSKLSAERQTIADGIDELEEQWLEIGEQLEQ